MVGVIVIAWVTV